jgi:hypothetical protein
MIYKKCNFIRAIEFMANQNEILTRLACESVNIWPISDKAATHLAIPVIEGFYRGQNIRLIDLARLEISP